MAVIPSRLCSLKPEWPQGGNRMRNIFKARIKKKKKLLLSQGTFIFFLWVINLLFWRSKTSFMPDCTRLPHLCSVAVHLIYRSYFWKRERKRENLWNHFSLVTFTYFFISKKGAIISNLQFCLRRIKKFLCLQLCVHAYPYISILCNLKKENCLKARHWTPSFAKIGI